MNGMKMIMIMIMILYQHQILISMRMRMRIMKVVLIIRNEYNDYEEYEYCYNDKEPHEINKYKDVVYDHGVIIVLVRGHVVAHVHVKGDQTAAK